MSEREPEDKELHEFDFHDSREGYVDDNETMNVAGASNNDVVKLLAIDHVIKRQSSDSDSQDSNILYELSTANIDSRFENSVRLPLINFRGYKRDSTETHIEKHTVKGPTNQSDMQRSEWIANVVDKLEKRWPSSFDKVKCLMTSISVSYII